MHSRKNRLDEAERRQFRDALAGVVKLAGTARQRPATLARPDRASSHGKASAAAPWHDPSPEIIHATGDQLAYCRDGVAPSALRKLQKASMETGGWLDLHGMTVAQARAALQALLQRAQEQGQRHIGIVHGKGLQSGRRGPVLKAHVASWLRQSAAVLAYVSARPEDGGTGAMYVRLKRNRSA